MVRDSGRARVARCKGLHIVLLLFGAGLLGALGALAQAGRAPWPPRPVVPPEEKDPPEIRPASGQVERLAEASPETPKPPTEQTDPRPPVEEIKPLPIPEDLPEPIRLPPRPQTQVPDLPPSAVPVSADDKGHPKEM